MPEVLALVSLLFFVTVIPLRAEDLLVMVGCEYKAPVQVTIKPVVETLLQSKAPPLLEVLNRVSEVLVAELKVAVPKKFVIREVSSIIV